MCVTRGLERRSSVGLASPGSLAPSTVPGMQRMVRHLLYPAGSSQTLSSQGAVAQNISYCASWPKVLSILWTIVFPPTSGQVLCPLWVLLYFISFHYWNIIALQFCIIFYCITQWISCTYPQVALVVKNPPANVRDVRDGGLIPGSGRFPGGRNVNPLQYTCLGNHVDRGAWRSLVHGVIVRRN